MLHGLLCSRSLSKNGDFARALSRKGVSSRSTTGIASGMSINSKPLVIQLRCQSVLFLVSSGCEREQDKR